MSLVASTEQVTPPGKLASLQVLCPIHLQESKSSGDGVEPSRSTTSLSGTPQQTKPPPSPAGVGGGQAAVTRPLFPGGDAAVRPEGRPAVAHRLAQWTRVGRVSTPPPQLLQSTGARRAVEHQPHPQAAHRLQVPLRVRVRGLQARQVSCAGRVAVCGGGGGQVLATGEGH